LESKKIILVDKDTVDYHNLNRQLLFHKEDIGKPKVQSAANTLEKTHNLRTQIETMHLDVLKNWDKVVAKAKECTIIFNMIDVGEYLDYATQSLALTLNIPFCIGGTFRNTLTVDFIPAGGKPCWACISDVPKKDIAAKLVPSLIQSYNSIDFIPPDDNPIGASNVFVCCTCCNFMLSAFVQNLNGIQVPNRIIFYYETYDIDKWTMESNPDCLLCRESGTGK